MSAIHFSIKATNPCTSSGNPQKYVVEFSSFIPGLENVRLGEIYIDKANNKYRFHPSSVWIDANGFLPHWLDGLEESEISSAINGQGKYVGYNLGAWAYSIHSRICKLIEQTTQS